MIVVLRNELLYCAGNMQIYKTYNPKLDRYGMFMPIPKGAVKHKAVFQHIFPFGADGRAAVITEAEVYRWMNHDWKMCDMTDAEKLEWSTTLVKGSRCNCADTCDTIDCPYCEYGIIYNTYGFKLLDRFFLGKE
jgi:hypothetical protein